MSVTVVVEVRSKEGTKCTLDSSVNLSLGLLPSLRFSVKNRNRVLSHDLSLLRSAFMDRIGELIEGGPVGRFNIVLEHIKKTIAEELQQKSLVETVLQDFAMAYTFLPKRESLTPSK